MRATRLQSASKRPAPASADPHWDVNLASGIEKIDAKQEEGKEAGATMRKRAKAPSPPPLPPPLTPAATTPSPPSLPPSLPADNKPRGLPERLGSLPLRCVLSGTNPSATAWDVGHAYAHRSNRFWPLLHAAPGLVPPRVSLLCNAPSSSSSSSSSASASSSAASSPSSFATSFAAYSSLLSRCSSLEDNGGATTKKKNNGDGEIGTTTGSSSSSSPFSGAPTDDELLNEFAGLGLCDVGTGHPETDCSAISSKTFAAWAPVYYRRLVEHVRRAASGVGCQCRSLPPEDDDDDDHHHHPSTCCAPRVIAFTGKRQFVELLNAGRGDEDPSKNKNKNKRAPPLFDSSSVSYGLQPRSLRPAGWPRCLSETEVWVLTTTSGAAGLTNEARAAPYFELGRRLAREAWPRPLPACCSAVKEEKEK